MTTMRKIEIDETTAIVLERRAADRGLSVADLVAELTEYATEPADNAHYVIRYRLRDQEILILRVFHGKGSRTRVG